MKDEPSFLHDMARSKMASKAKVKALEGGLFNPSATSTPSRRLTMTERPSTSSHTGCLTSPAVSNVDMKSVIEAVCTSVFAHIGAAQEAQGSSSGEEEHNQEHACRDVSVKVKVEPHSDDDFGSPSLGKDEEPNEDVIEISDTSEPEEDESVPGESGSDSHEKSHLAKLKPLADSNDAEEDELFGSSHHRPEERGSDSQEKSHLANLKTLAHSNDAKEDELIQSSHLEPEESGSDSQDKSLLANLEALADSIDANKLDELFRSSHLRASISTVTAIELFSDSEEQQSSFVAVKMGEKLMIRHKSAITQENESTKAHTGHPDSVTVSPESNINRKDIITRLMKSKMESFELKVQVPTEPDIESGVQVLNADGVGKRPLRVFLVDHTREKPEGNDE